MACGSSKMNMIADPLAQQKTAAANIGLNNYQTASGNVPSLQNYYNQNFGQTQGQTLQSENPMFQDIYGSLQKDLTGGGGPYASLKQNLLGSFDAGNAQNIQAQQQQLQAEGLGGSGAGMAVEGATGVNAAQQRALLGSQVDTQELSMADTLAQQLSAQNQQQGFTNPMMAEGQIQSLASPPNLGDINNTYYTPQNKFQTTADIVNAVAPMLFGQNFSGVGNAIAPPGGGQATTTNGAPSIAPAMTPPANYYTNGGQGVQSMMNNPQLLAQLAQMFGGG